MKEEVRIAYNKAAKEYHNLRTKKNTTGWFYNELLEMPTTLKLLGNIEGKKILDLGCGPGLYTKELIKRGAKVKAMDISEEEIKIAQKENPEIEFKVGDSENLPYNDKEFDIVLATLVLEHIEDWTNSLREIKRVLNKGGIFIFSTGNPVTNCIRVKENNQAEIKRNYFDEIKTKSHWWDGVDMIWYQKTYGTIIKILIKAGFELLDYEDSKPNKESEKLFPEDYIKADKLPYFCTWKWKLK